SRPSCLQPPIRQSFPKRSKERPGWSPPCRNASSNLIWVRNGILSCQATRASCAPLSRPDRHTMNVEITQLSNGLTVATDPMPQLESASLGVWVNCGARHETEPRMGISHMLEHMAFKGTERRTARGIAEEIEAVGGAL